MTKPLYRPRDGVCSRGWLFMGEQGGPCDMKCQMCYYAYQKNLVFYSLQTMIQHANLFRHYYGLDACDISGGEGTIYKHIIPLVDHCAKIGLRPTLISHGQNNRDDYAPKWAGVEEGEPLYQALERVGLEDWLISLHGGDAESHDAILGKAGSFDRLMAGLDLLKRPVRFNSTLQRENLDHLPVDILLDREPTVWNPIVFNPFHEWAKKTGKSEIEFQVTLTRAAEVLAPAIEKLEAAGWEVNVRYFPICIAEKFGFAENVSGYHQVPFDPWEWRLNATQRTPMPKIIEAGGWYTAEREMALNHAKQRDNPKCDSCSRRPICDGPQSQYQAAFGIEELIPHEGELLTDPLHFQKERAVNA